MTFVDWSESALQQDETTLLRRRNVNCPDLILLLLSPLLPYRFFVAGALVDTTPAPSYKKKYDDRPHSEVDRH